MTLDPGPAKVELGEGFATLNPVQHLDQSLIRDLRDEIVSA